MRSSRKGKIKQRLYRQLHFFGGLPSAQSKSNMADSRRLENCYDVITLPGVANSGEIW